VAAVGTSNLRVGDAPGNLRLTRRASRLPQESVVNVSQLLTLDREFLDDKIGRLPAATMSDVEDGLKLVLGLRGTA